MSTLAMPITIADAQLAGELWISFRALVESHAAMHSVAYPNDPWTISFANAGAVTLASTHALLQLNAPNSTGSGTWKMTARTSPPTQNKQHSTYIFTSEGLVCFDGEESPLEMEAAVERILSSLQNLERRA